MNKLQKVVHRRIQALQLDAEIAGEPEHSLTAGFLREKYITKFLSDMTPREVSLTSGILFDLADRTSPQLDLIATFNSVLPTIILDEGVSMVPVEAALWAIEIKTKLKSCHLNQLETQNQWIAQTAVVVKPDKTEDQLILPTAILALDSALSIETVRQWMQAQENGKLINGNTVMCCVIGKFYLVRNGDELTPYVSNGEFIETMCFIADYWGGLRHLQKQRQKATSTVPPSPYPHPLEAYLKALKPA